MDVTSLPSTGPPRHQASSQGFNIDRELPGHLRGPTVDSLADTASAGGSGSVGISLDDTAP